MPKFVKIYPHTNFQKVLYNVRINNTASKIGVGIYWVPRYWGRIFLALMIIPAGIGLTNVLIICLARFSSSCLPFLLGIICYTLTYPVFKKPLRSYIIGHELSHVLGIWFFRGKIHSVRIDKRGGMVKTDKANVWIALLPYFLPFYTLIVLGGYYLLSLIWNMARFYNWMVFILGITWAFHIYMNIYIIKQNQPDIRGSGILFSMVIIYTINVLILSLILIIISPEVNFGDFLQQSVGKIEGSYLWILKKLI